MKNKSTKVKKNTKSKNKEYQIRTFEDFTKVVNDKNVDMLCGNFYGVILQFIQMRKSNPKLKFTGFNWIDDGKLEIRKAKIKMEVSV